MEDILTSMRKQTESLDIKHENSWDSEADQVIVGASNGNIVHPNENTPSHNENEQDGTPETVLKNDFLINLEIGSKTIDNVAIRRDCQLQDVAETLADNEMVKVVYFLQEKIKKGGDNCDASEAQVLVKLKSNWKWIGLDELVEDRTMTLEEVFSDMPSYFKPLFSLAPKVNREFEGGEPITNWQQPLAVPLASPMAQATARLCEVGSENNDKGFIAELKALLVKYNVSELLKKESLLPNDILSSLTSEVSHLQPSQDKVLDLKKCLCGLYTMLNSFIPMSPKLHLHKQPFLQNNYSNRQEKIHHENCGGSQRQESYQQSNVQEIFPEQSTAVAPLSRQRTVFDPLFEVPRLKEWYEENCSPNKQTISHYVDELNASEFRRDKNPVADKAVYIWFKNMRARKDKIKFLKS